MGNVLSSDSSAMKKIDGIRSEPFVMPSVCMYVCMVITYSRVWINRVRLPILLVVS